MVTWMANWIRLPARQSKSTCATAVIVIKPMKRRAHSFVRWGTQLLITRRPQNYVSEFNSRCETRSRSSPHEMAGEMLSRDRQQGRQGREPFFSGHHGIG